MTRIHIDATTAQQAAYDVIVAHGSLGTLGEIARQCTNAHRFALITDRNVARHWGAAVHASLAAAALSTEWIEVEPGEAHKTRENWARITDRLLAAGLGRDAAIIALGGGVVGDLAGFVAATYMRGVPVVQVPTTLLAMVDASIGGKTGVDVAAGKNLVGAFHQPRAVLADPAVLRTLPATELRGGLAEALKHGVIADAGYFAWLQESGAALLSAEPDALTTLVLGSVRIKAGFVALDTLEAGPRAALNFGHTAGHAIERASNYEVPHGYAVALGMLAETAAGEAMGITAAGTYARLAGTFAAFELPLHLPAGMAAHDVLALTRTDKKARAGTVRYTLIERIGAVARAPDGQWTWPVDSALLQDALQALQR